MEIFIFLSLLICSVIQDGYANMDANEIQHEIKLRKDLFMTRKINPLTRPFQTINDTVDVTVYLYVYHVLSLDAVTETLYINAWLGHMWQDLNFAWNTEDYGGLKHVTLSPDQIWVPDVYLLNSVDFSNINSKASVPLLITNEGNIWWIPPGTFKSFCSMDIKAYPFDEHTCHLLFISWTYGTGQLNLSLMIENYSLTSFMIDEHNEWEIVSSHGNRTLIKDPANDQTAFTDLNFYIQFRRRAPFYRLTQIFPTFVATLITLIVFWIPPSSGHKPFVCGINIIILALLVINLYWSVPRNGSSVPGIIIFCGNAFFFAGLTFLLSIATTTIYKRPPISAPPFWLKKFLFGTGILIKILCLNNQQFTSGADQLLANDEEDEEISAKLDNNSRSDWQMIAIAFDRLGFIIYCLSLCIILICAFV